MNQLLSIYNDYDLTTERPFEKVNINTLVEVTYDLLGKEKIDLEVSTLIYNEIKKRLKSKNSEHLKAVVNNFKKIGHYPIPWLDKARKNISKLELPVTSENYTSSVYVILRDGYSQKNSRYGVYVGTTTKSVEERYKQHKCGYRSGRGLQKYGIQIMKSLIPSIKIKARERLYYESALNILLSLVVPKVSGDIQKPISEWPKGFQKKIRKLTEKKK